METNQVIILFRGLGKMKKSIISLMNEMLHIRSNPNALKVKDDTNN